MSNYTYLTKSGNVSLDVPKTLAIPELKQNIK